MTLQTLRQSVEQEGYVLKEKKNSVEIVNKKTNDVVKIDLIHGYVSSRETSSLKVVSAALNYTLLS